MKVTWLNILIDVPQFNTQVFQVTLYIVNKLDKSSWNKDLISWYTAAAITIVVIVTSHFNHCAHTQKLHVQYMYIIVDQLLRRSSHDE